MEPPDWNPDALVERLRSYAPYVGAGVVVTHVAEDASEIRVEMPLTDDNVNLVGTHFGGSLYSMVDPHLMILLIRRLGPGFVVWDKGASIDFRKPGLGTVRATVRVTDAEVDAIRAATSGGARHLPRWTLNVVDETGDVVAAVDKTLYVRRTRDG